MALLDWIPGKGAGAAAFEFRMRILMNFGTLPVCPAVQNGVACVVFGLASVKQKEARPEDDGTIKLPRAVNNRVTKKAQSLDSDVYAVAAGLLTARVVLTVYRCQNGRL